VGMQEIKTNSLWVAKKGSGAHSYKGKGKRLGISKKKDFHDDPHATSRKKGKDPRHKEKGYLKQPE